MVTVEIGERKNVATIFQDPPAIEALNILKNLKKTSNWNMSL